MTSFDRGPWICMGYTSGSLDLDVHAGEHGHAARPRSTSLSASDSQNRFSSTRSRTGSFTIPPSAR